jgi:hypothetical protein
VGPARRERGGKRARAGASTAAASLFGSKLARNQSEWAAEWGAVRWAAFSRLLVMPPHPPPPHLPLHQSAAKGSSTTVSRSDTRLI